MSRAAAVGLLLLLLPAQGWAQASSVPLSHWQHSAWTGDRAPPLPTSNSNKRSPDGYLWLGSVRGLIRFDGDRFTLIDSSYTPLLRYNTLGLPYDPLLVDRTGKMWVTSPPSLLLSYSNGTFQSELLDSGYVHSMAEDGNGRLWVAVETRLRLLRNGRFVPAPLPPAVPDTGILELLADNEGGIWIGTLEDGLWHVTGSVARHYGTGRLLPMLVDSEGTLWLANDRGRNRGVMRLKDGLFSPVYYPGQVHAVKAGSAAQGPDGSVWLSTFSAGVSRWRNGVLESFTARDGLSSNTTRGLMVSAEGAVWVLTDAGVDRLRPAAFVPVELRDGIPDEAPASFALDTSGALWAAVRSNDLYRLDNGIVRGRPGPAKAERFQLNGVQVNLLEVLARSSRGGIWLAPRSSGGLVYFSDGRVRTEYGPREGVPAARPWTAVEGPDGTLWVRHFPGGFGRLRHGQYRSVNLPEPGPDNMAFDGTGRLWIVPTQDKVALAIAGDSVVQRVPLPPAAGRILSLACEGGDTLWAAGQRSLFRIANGRAVEVQVPAIATILLAISRVVVAREHLWVASQAGLAALPLIDLNRVADGDTVPLVPTFFDQLDGLVTPRSKASTRKSLQVGPDGRLWIATPTGFAVTDDSPQVPNRVPPIVHIEEVSLNGTRITLDDGGTVQPNPGRLAFRISVPSLGIPERMRVEYRLEGSDKGWNESESPRLVLYDHLRPGRYQFQVRAWNESGLPGVAAAALSFRVLPAWYQGNWFLALCILSIGLIGAIVAHYTSRSRHRRAAAAVEARYEAVLAERTRLARELHDTLLQGFTGLTLQIDGVRAALQERNEEQSAALASILERADRTLRDAREMVWDIRKAAPEDLGKALRAEGEALANPDKVALEYVVLGAPRALAPMVVTTLLRIAREAMANALTHARATRIVVTLAYEVESVELAVQDDGCGADPRAIETASARGHWGVAGMRERARSVGAALSVSTEPGKGTRVGVQVMAPPDRRRAQSG